MENRAWPVSSWASTHIRISSAVMLHSSAKRSMLPGSTVMLVSCRGIGRSYWPNACVAIRPTIEPTAMPIIDGAIILLRLAIIAIIGSALSSMLVGSDGVDRLAERGGQLGEQRSVRLERSLRPRARRDRNDLGRWAVEAGQVANVQFGDLGQLAELDAHGGIDVDLGGATRCGEPGELPGRIPVERALTGQRTCQIAEHRKVLERVLGLRSVCHEREPTACVGASVRRHDRRFDDNHGVGQRRLRRPWVGGCSSGSTAAPN